MIALAFALDAWDRRKLGCSCCRYVALDVDVPIGERTCPVCGWFDDAVQSNHPMCRDGPNEVSLAEARENFARHGAAAERAHGHVRLPRPEEIPPWMTEQP